MRTAVYPGSFDPITFGHVDLIRRGLTITDRLIVGVLGNTIKSPLFTAGERVAQVKSAVKGIGRVDVISFDGLLVDFMKRTKAKMVLRGLRAVSDFEYEFQMALMNRRLRHDVETVFLMAGEPYTYLSSSIVKQIARFGGSVKGLVPPKVASDLKLKLGRVR